MPEPLRTFATPEAMQKRTEGEIGADHPHLVRELEAATEAIRGYCKWHIAGREQVTHTEVRPFRRPVFIPAMKIASIDAGQVDGRDLAGADIAFDPDTGWTELRGCRVHVVYTAGYENVPADLEALTLELAAAALGSPLGVTREQAGGVSLTFARTSSALLVGEGGADIPRLAPYRLGPLP